MWGAPAAASETRINSAAQSAAKINMRGEQEKKSKCGILLQTRRRLGAAQELFISLWRVIY